mgnify:FL=1
MKALINNFVCILLVTMLTGSITINAQTSKFDWDGDPFFRDWKTGFNEGISPVMYDTLQVLQLTPQIDTTFHTPENPLKISGIPWKYPNEEYPTVPIVDDRALRRAIDVDDVSEFYDGPAYLITEQDFNKVIVYDPNSPSGAALWHYSELSGPSDSDMFLEGNSKRVLVTNNGTHEIIILNVDRKRIQWRYGEEGRSGIEPGLLNSPYDAEKIDETGEILIADTGNKRVIIIDITQNDSITWDYRGVPGETISPVDIEYVVDDDLGHCVLITDQTSHRVRLVSREDQNVLWEFGNGIPGNSPTQLTSPADADWVATDTTHRIIIADKGNNRIIELDINDDSYFYEWPNPTPSIDDVDATANGGFLVCQRTEFDSGPWLPAELEFSSAPETKIPEPLTLGKDVDFEQLFWDTSGLSSETSVEFKFRSTDNPAFFTPSLQFIGPDGSNTSSYTISGQQLFRSHKVHSWYQYSATLRTDNPRVSPTIDSVGVSYITYDDSEATINTSIRNFIGPAPEDTVNVQWDRLTLNWIVPNEERNLLGNMEYEVVINNADSAEPIYRFGRRPVFPGAIIEPLREVAALRGVERIYLTIRFYTNNSALTPRLDSWRVDWTEFPVEPATLQFVDESFEEQPFYTAADYIPAADDSIFVDRAYLKLSNTLEPVDTLQVDITSRSTLDVETTSLIFNPEEIYYGSARGIPMHIVQDIADVSVNNDTLEIFDRDELYSEFQSSQRPGDFVSDSTLCVQGTLGTLQVLNQAQSPITRAMLDETLYARVSNEADRNLDPNATDSLMVTFVNNATDDLENLWLYQTTANSDTFASNSGIQLIDELNYTENDGMLYSRGGDVIQVVYQDNFKKTPTIRRVQIGDSIGVQIAEALVCDVAPNPFRSSRHLNFKLRVGSSLGDVVLEQVEVFNLAGERVLDMDGANIVFTDWGSNTVPINQYGILNNWWALVSDTGHPVSSGTYWVKVHARVDKSDGTSEQLDALQKFVVIR